MNESDPILEQHIFLSERKDHEVYHSAFEKIFTFPVADITVEYSDQPNAAYSTINDRTKKILASLPRPDKINCIAGRFSDGGDFRLQSSNLHVCIRESEYNYDLISNLKNFLGPVFPLWIFRNPYIWGVNVYEDYERQHFFEARKYSARSQHLEEPEIDIYRRDDGVIHKYRFFMREQHEPEEGLKLLAPHFNSMRQGLQKRNYEGLEVLHTYCTDKSTFRRLEPRTKLGKDIKSVLSLD
ncbi:MAG: hypothetical protein CVV42_09360 [Candidatus Riflebacteria bacterium HGW-Riflebacteria-2]|jgi:hypothetical protein|nr:MAG: hypothetical protein CVV42_09360 [Candidatus Riflebacteria bacterium HGW-Riflebacteria-2]